MAILKKKHLVLQVQNKYLSVNCIWDTSKKDDIMSRRSNSLLHKKWNFPLSFTEEIVNGKLYFLCSGAVPRAPLILSDLVSFMDHTINNAGSIWLETSTF